jgi:hypothetical protein
MNLPGLARRSVALGACAALLGGAAAQADTVGNPGPITARFTGGSLAVTGLFDLPFTAATPVTATGTIGPDGKLSFPASGVTFPAATATLPIPAPNTPLTAQVVADDVSGSLDPATGAATLRIRGHVDVVFGASAASGAACSLGTAAAPIDINLSTASPGGAGYSAADRGMTLFGNSWDLPGLSGCTGPMAPQVAFLQVPLLSPAPNNQLKLIGTLDRDVLGVSAPAGQGTTPNNPAPTSSNPSGGGEAGSNTPAPGCKVPNLKKLTLAAAKKRLKAAHCAAGKVTRKRSSAKKGTVIAQGSKAGRKLAAGARVALTLSDGPAKKKTTRRS